MQPIEFGSLTTRAGDRGESSLHSGERRRKDDMVFECLGDLDELQSHIGLAKAESAHHVCMSSVCLDCAFLQERLSAAMAMVATIPPALPQPRVRAMGSADVQELERRQFALMEATRLADSFVLPGASRLSALFDVCRTIARRCERRMTALIAGQDRVDLRVTQPFLNRCSDYLFVAARYADQALE